MIESGYNLVYDTLKSYGLSEAWCFAIMFHATHDLVVWSGTLLCLAIDYFQLFSSYKIQQNKWPDKELVKRAFREQFFRSLTNPFLLWAIFQVLGPSGGIRMQGPLDDWPLFLAKCVVFFIFLDVCFYWSHRTAHHPWLYQRIHKQHHLFKQSVGVAFEYASLPEQLLINGLPLFVGLLFLKMHMAQFCLFLVVRLQETIDAHSGYDFPWSPWRLVGGARPHDLHHSHQVGNFGIFFWWDWICGTRVQDVRAKQK